jgi:hypothetical protein
MGFSERAQASHQSNKIQLYNVGSGTQGQEEFGKLQCQDELSRPSWNVHFDKEQDGQVVLF